jgi:tRNA (cmo5U34)-methyltransferase
MQIVKEHFDDIAKGFDEQVVKSAPRYREMLETVVAMLPFHVASKIDIIDIGTGTGNLAYMLKSIFPEARLVCLDLSSNMLEVAREKLKHLSSVEFVQKSIEDYKLDRKFDVIASSLTLHHLENDSKKHAFHVKAFRALKDGGMFVNADIVTAPEKEMQNVNLRAWKEHVLRSATPEFVQANYKRYLTEDRPAVLLNELNSIKKAGFRYVDVFWKYYNFAVYGGKK